MAEVIRTAPNPVRLGREGTRSSHFDLVRIVVRRVLQALLVILGVTFFTFALMNLLPGGAAIALAGPGASKADIEKLTVELKLNQPFFERYWHWLAGAVQGNLGNSLANGRPVSQILAARVPVTFELVLIALVVSLILVIPLAVLAASKPNGVVDRISSYVSITGLAVPNFILGIILVLIFAVHLGWVPAFGYKSLGTGLVPNVKSLILPATALGVPLSCTYLRVLRGDLIDQLNGQDYIVTARAKGLRRWRILLVHALRNSLFGLLTLVGLNLGVLMGGTVLIEEIFGVPGVGQELITAISLQDVIAVEAMVVVLSLAVVLASVLTDIVYDLLDPRIRYGRPVQ